MKLPLAVFAFALTLVSSLSAAELLPIRYDDGETPEDMMFDLHVRAFPDGGTMTCDGGTLTVTEAREIISLNAQLQ